MDQRDHVRLEIENTRAALADKILLLEDKVAAARQRVRHSVDIRYQYHAHPWPFLGAAVLTGFLVGYLTA